MYTDGDLPPACKTMAPFRRPSLLESPSVVWIRFNIALSQTRIQSWLCLVLNQISLPLVRHTIMDRIYADERVVELQSMPRNEPWVNILVCNHRVGSAAEVPLYETNDSKQSIET